MRTETERAPAFGAKSSWPDLKILNEQKGTAAEQNDFYFLPLSFPFFSLFLSFFLA